MDSQIRPEFDRVSPEAEIEHVDRMLKKLNSERKTINKKRTALDTADAFNLEIVLLDKNGDSVPIKGADGEEYDKITYTEVTSKNLRSLMVNASIGLMSAIPNAENLGLRFGGELHRLDLQEREYVQRRARAENLIAERERQEKGTSA